MTFNPNVISVGTTPESIHEEATRAIQISMGMAGSICEALRLSPMMAPRRVMVREVRARIYDSAAAERSRMGPTDNTASLPAMMIMSGREISRNIRGISDTAREG